MNLAGKLDTYIEYNGRKYKLDLSFDNVLRVYDVQREDIFTPAQKTSIAVELLAGRSALRLPVADQQYLIKRISDEYINAGSRPAKKGEPRILDFQQDAPLIYAAFRQAYGIDLDKEQGRLDWRFFTALLQGLPENTRLREVMGIRKRPLPAPTKYNAEEIRLLAEAKAFYKIEMSESEAEDSFQAGVDRLATSLISRAKAGV